MKKLCILLTVIILFSLSCGNSSSPTTPNNQPLPKKIGRILIIVNGLTVGANADITVSGPNNYSKHLISDTLLDSLEIGTYTIAVSSVVNTTGDTLQTTTPSQTVLIKENQTASINISYSFKYGSLRIFVNGLPNNLTDAMIDISNSQNQNWSVKGIDTLYFLLPGYYTVISHSVVPNGVDSLFATPESLQVNIIAGSYSDAYINYNGGLSFKVFTQKNNGSVSGNIGTYIDGSHGNDALTNFDINSVIRYTNDGCQLTAVDITDTGFTKSISGSFKGGSLATTQTLTISKQNKSLEMITHTSVAADVPASTHIGTIGVRNETKYLPLILQIDNPAFDSVEVKFHWEITGSTNALTNDASRASASVHAWMHLPAAACYTALNTIIAPVVFNGYEDHLNTNDNLPLVGETTIIFKYTNYYFIGVDFYTDCIASSFQEAQGASHDGSGSASGEMTAVISITIENFK